MLCTSILRQAARPGIAAAAEPASPPPTIARVSCQLARPFSIETGRVSTAFYGCWTSSSDVMDLAPVQSFLPVPSLMAKAQHNGTR